MVDVKAFKGVVYNKAEIKDVEKVFAPPYDVITPQAVERYYDNHDYNIVRLILGKEFPADNSRDNKYTRAASFLGEWLGQGVLKQDEEPAIYYYVQDYVERGKKKNRAGFIALMRLEDFGKGSVLPHENTHAKPKQDRLNLLRSVKANLSPIFSLFDDKKEILRKISTYISSSAPYIDVHDKELTRHRLWSLTDKKMIKMVREAIKGQKVFIADGHHRYETALSFRNEMKKKIGHWTGREPFNYCLMYFTGLNGKGITILPTHRLVKYHLRFEEALEKIKDSFHIKKVKTKKEMLKSMGRHVVHDHKFGVYTGKGRYYILTLKNENILEEAVKVERSFNWKRLDVSILHNLLLPAIIPSSKIEEEIISYTEDMDKAIESVDNNTCNVAFLLNPTMIQEVKDIALRGERMPHKSTFFYPKLLSGLVINKFN